MILRNNRNLTKKARTHDILDKFSNFFLIERIWKLSSMSWVWLLQKIIHLINRICKKNVLVTSTKYPTCMQTSQSHLRREWSKCVCNYPRSMFKYLRRKRRSLHTLCCCFCSALFSLPSYTDLPQEDEKKRMKESKKASVKSGRQWS